MGICRKIFAESVPEKIAARQSKCLKKPGSVAFLLFERQKQSMLLVVLCYQCKLPLEINGKNRRKEKLIDSRWQACQIRHNRNGFKRNGFHEVKYLFLSHYQQLEIQINIFEFSAFNNIIYIAEMIGCSFNSILYQNIHLTEV